jgi:hypothetical protein
LQVDVNSEQQESPLLPCALSSRRLFTIALPLLYSNVSLDKDLSGQFFLESLEQQPQCGRWVRTLKVNCHGIFPGLTDLKKCLSMARSLRRCHLPLEELRDEQLLHQLFFEVESLEHLELIATSSLLNAGNAISSPHNLSCKLAPDDTCALTTLTFRPNSASEADFLHHILPRCPKLRFLDVSYTNVNCEILLAISSKARMTHLILSHCQSLSGRKLAEFLTTHPAVKDSLVALDCSEVSIYNYEPLDNQDIAKILSHLPQTLRSLNLTGFNISRSHLPYLRDACKQLEELSVGGELTVSDLEHVILGRGHTFDEMHGGDFSPSTGKCETIMGPMEDAVALCRLKKRLNSVAPRSPRDRKLSRSRLRYLDLSSMTRVEQAKISKSVLLGAQSMPLEIIELSGIYHEDLGTLKKVVGAVGWRCKWIGSRFWIERRGK